MYFSEDGSKIFSKFTINLKFLIDITKIPLEFLDFTVLKQMPESWHLDIIQAQMFPQIFLIFRNFFKNFKNVQDCKNI